MKREMKEMKREREEARREMEELERRAKEENERRERDKERERRRERREHRKDEKVEIPCFPNAPYWDLYVPWEKEVNKIYLCQRISDEELISLVILKFKGSVLTWWNKMERIWKHEKKTKDRYLEKDEVCAKRTL